MVLRLLTVRVRRGLLTVRVRRRLLTVRVRRRLLTVWGGLAVWIGLLTIGVMRLAAGITRRRWRVSHGLCTFPYVTPTWLSLPSRQ